MNVLGYPGYIQKSKRIFTQSRLIHPDWTADDHRNYIRMEEGWQFTFSSQPKMNHDYLKEFVESLPIESWLKVSFDTDLLDRPF